MSKKTKASRFTGDFDQDQGHLDLFRQMLTPSPFVKEQYSVEYDNMPRNEQYDKVKG